MFTEANTALDFILAAEERIAELTRERDEAVVEQDRLRSVAFMACLDVQDTPMWNDLSERWKEAIGRATTAEARVTELEARLRKIMAAIRALAVLTGDDKC